MTPTAFSSDNTRGPMTTPDLIEKQKAVLMAHYKATAERLMRERDRFKSALDQISRMKVTPDDKMNRMTLAAARQIAMVAVTEGPELSRPDAGGAA